MIVGFPEKEHPYQSESCRHSVVIYYGGFFNRAGGAFAHTSNIGGELNRCGWNVKVITLDNLPIWLRYLPHLAEKFVNAIHAPLGFLVKAYLTKIMYKIFFNYQADLQIFEDIYLSWNSETPSVAILHAVWSDNLQSYTITEKRQQQLRQKEAEIINRIAHPVITVSYPYRHYICDEHFYNLLTKEINVVELGIDQTIFHDIPKMERINKSIIYTGALEARKNVLFLLELFKMIYEKNSTYTLTVVGDGPDKKRLTAFAGKHQLPVRFLGRVHNDVVLTELHRHEIYIHTSIKESFSYSLLEAKLAGLKTVAYSKLQIPAEFIDVGIDKFCLEEWCCGVMEKGTGAYVIDASKYTSERMAQSTLELFSINNKDL